VKTRSFLAVVILAISLVVAAVQYVRSAPPPNPPSSAIGATYPLGWSAATGTSGAFIPFSVDANGNLNTNASATIAFPFTGGAVGVATAASQSIGLQAFNSSSGQMDPVQLDASDNVKTFDTLGPGTASIGVATLTSWTPVIVTGAASGAGDGFGGGCSPTPTCDVVIKGSPGILLDIRFNSTTALGTTVARCWNALTIGATSIANQVFVGTNMSAGANPTFGGSGGQAFSVGLLCETSVALGTAQNFAFNVR
jgi:hypothetical protein